MSKQKEIKRNPVFDTYEEVYDRFGKQHKVYTAAIIDMKEIQQLSFKFNSDAIFLNLLTPKTEKDGTIMREENGDLIYDDSPINAMIDITYLALNRLESKEEIMKWLDIRSFREIWEVFCEISHLKKTMEMMAVTQNGTD